MCNFKSGIILKNKVVLAPEGDESHSDLLVNLGIKDNHLNAIKTFVRAELIPKNNNKASDISKWRYKVDQDIVPDWYEKDPERYEQEFRDSVRRYMKKYFEERNISIICGYGWTSVKEDNFIYYFMEGILKKSMFGDTNNYSESYVRHDLNESVLVKRLKEKFGDRLIPISLDLTSMDGFKDYGKVEGDFLSIPNIQLFMKFGNKIPLINDWYWLATPNQTPARKDASYVRYVRTGGFVDYDGCLWDGRGVRPFFILKA